MWQAGLLLLIGGEGTVWQRDVASGTNKEGKDFKESSVSVLCSSLVLKSAAVTLNSLLSSNI